MHADAGYMQSLQHDPHRAATLDAVIGMGPGDDLTGGGLGGHARVKLGDSLTTVALGPSSYFMAGRDKGRPLDFLAELSAPVGVESVNGEVSGLFLPTLRAGVSVPLNGRDSRELFEGLARFFILATVDYSVHTARLPVNSASLGLSFGIGLGEHSKPNL